MGELHGSLEEYFMMGLPFGNEDDDDELTVLNIKRNCVIEQNGACNIYNIQHIQGDRKGTKWTPKDKQNPLGYGTTISTVNWFLLEIGRDWGIKSALYMLSFNFIFGSS